MKVSKKQVLAFFVYIFSCYISKILYPGIETFLMPSLYFVPLFFVPFVLLKKVKYTLNKWLINIWLWFYPLGLLNIATESRKYEVWKMKVDYATFIYFIFLITFILAVIFFEKFFRRKKIELIPDESLDGKREKVHPIIRCFLYIFPLLYFIDFIQSIGYIPILSGKNFVGDIYNLSHGSLYGYVIFISVSICLFVYEYIQTPKGHNKRKIYVIMVIASLFISVMNGKRSAILTSTLSGFVFYSFYIKRIQGSKTLYITCGLGAILYFFIVSLREGNLNNNFFPHYLQNFPIGVEFKDFVYAANNFVPGEIKGYDYFASSIGSIMNGNLLSFFGFDKTQLINNGSAYVWKNIYNQLFSTDYGIRTGLFSELFFAYSYFGLLVIPLFALIIVYISSSIENGKKSVIGTILFSIAYGLSVLLIVGQSTDYWGQLILLFYVGVINYFFRINSKERASFYSYSSS